MKTNRNPWDVPPSRDVTLRVWHHFSWFQSKHGEFLMLVASCWFSKIPSGYVKIAIENVLFIVHLPIEHGDFP